VRVLIVQDSPPPAGNSVGARIQLDQLRRTLTEGFEVDVVTDTGAAASPFNVAKYDLGIIELTVPGLADDVCRNSR
jgi:DNA-binding response OmpR family regulator